MGLKCSVLGHSYGDVSVDRDRAEQGSEVVITIREIETCDRCGTERIVSENKEVTSIATPDEPAAPDESNQEAEAPTGQPDSAGMSPGAAPDLEGASADTIQSEPSEAAGSTDVEAGSGGGEILDAESGEPADDELADPSIEDPDSSDEPMASETTEDAVFVDEDDDTPGRGPGEWPDESGDAEEDAWKPDVTGDGESGTDQQAAAEPDVSAVTVPDGQFRCPECGFTTAVESSSLRAGDFCPDCHTGSLVHDTGE
jgi:ssDNA-binding Zn-finger/Zn-ribbon topoisomerase 1